MHLSCVTPMGAVVPISPEDDSTIATREEPDFPDFPVFPDFSDFPDFPDFPDLLVFAAFPVLGALGAFDVDSYGITEVGGM